MTEGEHLQETELESGENFEKPEVILKSALVKPDIEDSDSYQQNNIIEDIESVDIVQELSAETEANPENNLEILDDYEPHVQVQIEETIITEQFTENLEEVENQENQIVEEKEATEVEIERKDSSVSYTEETLTQISEAESSALM